MKAAFAFLTVLGGAAVPDRRTFAWFPVVGAVLGASLGVVWWGAGEMWSPLVAAAIVVTADLIATGMLHVDGLADSADGLLPPLASAERRLEVMADPTTGAFGVAVVAMLLVLRVAALSSIVLPVDDAELGSALASGVLVLAGIWCMSRTTIAAVAGTLPYVRPGGGIASAFLGDDDAARGKGRAGFGARLAMAAGGSLSVTLGSTGGGMLGALAVASVFVGAGVVVLLGWRRLGGFTGDVLGAACVTGETVGLLVLAIR